MTGEELDALRARVRQARAELFGQIGTVDTTVRVRGLAPSFVRGEPSWPSGGTPALRSIARDRRTVLVTDGLSDPYDLDVHPGIANPQLGCACELLVETSEPIVTVEHAPGTAPMHWLEWVLWQAADFEAEQRVLYDMLATFSAITLQVAPCPGLEASTLPSGMVAVLAGAPGPGLPSTFPGPAIDPALVPLKVLTPDEYEHAVAQGASGGVDLVQRFAARGDHHLNVAGRPSVLAEPQWTPPHARPEASELIPSPHELVPIDKASKTVNLAILVVGDAARRAMRTIHDSTTKGPTTPDTSTGGTSSVTYFTLHLAEIRGYTTVLHMYGLPDDPALADVVGRMLPQCRGLIIAHEATGRPTVLPSAMPKLPTAVLGPEDLRRAWEHVAGAPSFGAAVETEAIFPALKAVARGVLEGLRGRLS